MATNSTTVKQGKPIWLQSNDLPPPTTLELLGLGLAALGLGAVACVLRVLGGTEPRVSSES